MNRFESVTGETISHSTRLPNDGNQVAGYNPLMWFMALLLAAFVAGCGGGSGSSAPGSARAITAYSLNNVSGTIDETAKTIAVTMPYGTNVTALVATFTTTGTSTKLKVGAAVQTSGTTANNFASPVEYKVTAADRKTATYIVTVTVAPITAKAITAYSLAGVAGTINGTAIAVTLPYGTSKTALTATFTITGTSVKVGTTVQTSGTTVNNFTSPVSYIVTAGDTTTATYTVTVTVPPITAKAITAYSLAGVAGTIDETAKTIAVTVPNGTSKKALVATFTTTGTGVKVGTTVQTSASTSNNFASPVAYTVTAGDSTTATYTVTVTVTPISAKAITAYSLAGVAGTIDEAAKTIAVTVPTGTNVTALVATFTTIGTSIKVGATDQTSGTTPNNFTSPVSYTVTAADATTATYTVTVTVALNSAKTITSYSLAGITGTINEAAKTIAVTMPNGTSVTALSATFATTGTSVKVGAAAQTSGTTANDFTSPVAYTVTAADSTTATYTATVTVTAASSTAKAITAYSLGGVTGTITGTNIAVTVPNGTNVTALAATFATTGAGVKVGATPQASGTTPNNFTSPVTYTVTAGNASTATYTVTVTVAVAKGPAPVDLGTAGNFVILAKTGVSTTGTTAVTGDIGVSPAAASYITGFALIADASNIFSTSSLVTGNVYASNYAVPTPANMTTAVSDMETAFTDAAGRTVPAAVTELGAGNISGMTLVPGLYKWSTGLLITSAGVTLSGGANDVWIFQIAQNLTVNNSAIITLSGGAQAKNIFWQVSGQATLGTAVDFKGIILSQTLISLNTGAVLKGRALAQTAVTLDASTVTAP